MSLTSTEQAVAGAAGAVVAVLFLIVFIWVWRSRRALNRRLTTVVTRLEGPDGGASADHGRGMERLLHRLEKAADDNVLRLSEADAAVQRAVASLERVEDGVVVWDDHGTVVLRNGAAAAALDVGDGAALVDQTLSDLRDAALAGETRTEGLELFGPPARTLVVSCAPLDDGWRTVGAVAVVHDVSERRRVEAMRRDFVANVGHELKTPIAALALLATTLSAEEDTVIARRLAVRMRNEAARVGAVLDELLDLGRVEAAERPVREPVPVGAVVAAALDRVRPVATLAGVQVDVAEMGPQVSVMGDRSQLGSAVGHLLDNAVKYSPRGGVVEVSAEADGAFVAVVVRDQGIGISARDVDRVFERFYRTESGRRHAAGSGLGLSIVRHVADSHGGSVDVASEEGKGSVFTLRLPVASQAVRVAS